MSLHFCFIALYLALPNFCSPAAVLYFFSAVWTSLNLGSIFFFAFIIIVYEARKLFIVVFFFSLSTHIGTLIFLGLCQPFFWFSNYPDKFWFFHLSDLSAASICFQL